MCDVCVCLCVSTRAHACVETHGVLPCLSPSRSLEARSLTEPGTGLAFSFLQEHLYPHPAFSIGAWDLNVDLHLCWANTLTPWAVSPASSGRKLLNSHLLSEKKAWVTTAEVLHVTLLLRIHKTAVLQKKTLVRQMRVYNSIANNGLQDIEKKKTTKK